MQHALVASLRARRVDVVTALDCGMVGRSAKTTYVTPEVKDASCTVSTLKTTVCSTSNGSLADKSTPGSFSHSSSAIPLANNCGGYYTS
jgi:hypothetical protein